MTYKQVRSDFLFGLSQLATAGTTENVRNKILDDLQSQENLIVVNAGNSGIYSENDHLDTAFRCLRDAYAAGHPNADDRTTTIYALMTAIGFYQYFMGVQNFLLLSYFLFWLSDGKTMEDIRYEYGQMGLSEGVLFSAALDFANNRLDEAIKREEVAE